MALIEESRKAASLLLDHSYVRIVVRQAPDAICAAALLAHALRRENVDFHFSAIDTLDAPAVARLVDEKNDALALIGLGGDDADVAALAGRRLVIDRFGSAPAGEVMLTPGLLPERTTGGLAALAYFVGVAVSKRNRDLAVLAAAGMMAELRHAGGIVGLEADIVSQAVDANVLLREPGLALAGADLAQALTHLESPYVAGVTGRARNVRKLLGDLHLPSDSPPSALSKENAERLGSFLALRLLAQEAPDAAFDVLFRPTLRALAGPYTGMDASTLARQAEACCADGRGGLAFAALWPDASAGSDVLDAQAKLREELVAALTKAERDLPEDGPLAVVEAPRAAACMPVATRVATSLLPEGWTAAARHESAAVVTLALRGPVTLGRAVLDAAAKVGAEATAASRQARVQVAVPDEPAFLDALVGALK